MSDSPQGPPLPPAGWYSIGQNELAYFDGRLWTWRGRWGAGGEWSQEPVVPPSPSVPATASPADLGVPPGTRRPGTELPRYPAVPGGDLGAGAWGAPRVRPPGRLDLHLTEPMPQARWKTLLRGLLVLPNAVALVFMELAVFFVTIVMWFAALFTARVPEGLWRFSSDVLKWQARTYGYASFLTDQYPPYRTGDVDFPVSIALDGPPDRFNRWAVLFRAILIIPAGIVAEVFSLGVGVFSVAIWLVTLVAGRCPRPLHLMIAACLRYSLRVNAYNGLLTTEYPSRPLGDPASPGETSSLPGGDVVLAGAARGLAIVALVIGALLYVGWYVVLPASGIQVRVSAQHAISELNAIDTRSTASETRYRNRAEACSTWTCLRGASPILLRSLSTQVSSLEAITFPTSTTQSDADALITALRGERVVVAQMEHARSRRALASDFSRLTALTRRLRPLVTKLERDLDSIS